MTIWVRQQPRHAEADASVEPPLHLESAGSVLRGGAWIGYLERGAVAATLLAGFPEGLALVLAVKGVGRYPELRDARSRCRRARGVHHRHAGQPALGCCGRRYCGLLR